MKIDNKQLAQDLAARISIEPTYDMLLVKPLKPVMISKLMPVAPTTEAKNLAEVENAEPTEPTKQKVAANMRKGIVLKLGSEYSKNNPENITVGDVVIYPAYAGVAMELLKDSRLLRRYEVLGIERL